MANNNNTNKATTITRVICFVLAALMVVGIVAAILPGLI